MSKQEPKLWRIKPFQVKKDLQANIQVHMRLDVMSRILFNVHVHVWCFFNMLPQTPAQFNNKSTMNFESFLARFILTRKWKMFFHYGRASEQQYSTRYWQRSTSRESEGRLKKLNKENRRWDSTTSLGHFPLSESRKGGRVNAPQDYPCSLQYIFRLESISWIMHKFYAHRKCKNTL